MLSECVCGMQLGSVLQTNIITWRLSRLHPNNNNPKRKQVLLDHPDTLSQLLATVPKPKDGDGPGPTLGLFIKVDCGYHRAGLADLDEIAALARTVVEEGERKGLLRFAGIYSHSGHSYVAKDSRERILGACVSV